MAKLNFQRQYTSTSKSMQKFYDVGVLHIKILNQTHGIPRKDLEPAEVQLRELATAGNRYLRIGKKVQQALAKAVRDNKVS